MSFTKKILKTSLFIGSALGTMAILNRITESMAGELDTVLTGEERRYPWKYGDMFYEVKGKSGSKPLVLIHGFGPGASSYEWRKNIDALAEQFHVYALDLFGYGLSDRADIDYDGEMYTDLISDFIKEVVGKEAVVVAHGVASAYVIAGAYRRPHLFERLVLVAPSPLILQEESSNVLNSLWSWLLQTPILGQFIYNLLTTRQAIRGYYDKWGYHNPGLITDELVEYIYTSAHQPSSRYAQAAFLGGKLYLDVHEPLARLQVPTVAVWGREGVLTPSEASAAFKRVNANVEVRIFDKASQQLQDEQATPFNAFIRELNGVAIN